MCCVDHERRTRKEERMGGQEQRQEQRQASRSVKSSREIATMADGGDGRDGGLRGAPSGGTAGANAGGNGVMIPWAGPASLMSFFHTVVYRDFVSFCERCRQARTIGVVYGVSGVGKTLAARAYTQWDRMQTLITPAGIMLPALLPEGLRWRGALYTVERTMRPKQLENDIGMLRWSMRQLAKDMRQQRAWMEMEAGRELEEMEDDPWQLLLVDNVQYLDTTYVLDVVQNIFDRDRIGMVLLGPASIVKDHALSRHAPLKTRIGRYYGLRLLSPAEIAALVTHVVAEAALTVVPVSGKEEWLVSSIHVMTRGNMSLVGLLLDQVMEEVEREKTQRLTEAVLHKAYQNLRWS